MNNDKNPSVNPHLHRTIIPEQQGTLLCAAYKTDKLVCRAIVLALFAGLRRRELLKLTYQDIDLKRMVIRVHTPNGSVRTIPISEVLAEWLAFFPVGAPDDLVFPLSPSEFSRRLARVVRIAGIGVFGKGFLRRAYCASAMWFGLPLAMTQKILGHSPKSKSVLDHCYESGKEFLTKLTPSALKLGNSPAKE